VKNNILVIAVLGALSSTAMAEGFYGVMDVGRSNAEDMCSATNFGGNTSCSTRATAFRVGGGYNFTRHIGVELNYGDLGNVNPVYSPGYSQSTKATTIQAAATGSWPITNKFSVIGKLGLAQTKFKQTWTTGSAHATDTNISYGVGAQYALSNSFAVRIQYEDLGKVGSLPITATSGTGRSRITLLSAGVIYNF